MRATFCVLSPQADRTVAAASVAIKKVGFIIPSNTSDLTLIVFNMVAKYGEHEASVQNFGTIFISFWRLMLHNAHYTVLTT